MKKYITVFFLLICLNAIADRPDTIIQVTWRQIQGVPVTIDSIHRPHTNVSGFTQPGIYKFEFTVVSSFLDSLGNNLTAKDTMQIEVFPATVLAIIHADISYQFVNTIELINWSVIGNNIQLIVLQKSYDGATFFDLQTVHEIGTKDQQRENKGSFFRIKTLSDNYISYSKIIYIPGTNEGLTVHQEGYDAVIWSDLPGKYILYDASGRMLKYGIVVNGMTRISVNHLPSQALILKIQTGEGISTFKMPNVK